MNVVILVSIGIGCGLLLALALVVRKNSSSAGRLPLTAEWIDELSMERYRPMLRLLDEEDFQFLRTQPGYTPELGRRLRAQRCQIFRGYLRCLNADFGRVCTAIKLLMVQSRNDRADLGAALLQHQLRFASGIMLVKFRLFLYRWGVCSVDVTVLIKTFDVMRLELRTLVPASAAMVA